MLRITVQEEPDRITLKLEGNLDGIWVTELEDSWRTAKSTFASGRSFRLDLTAVDRVAIDQQQRIPQIRVTSEPTSA
jgi:ABC-type transporter Mla MlaB component